jgi:hypothetical protein
MRFLKKQDAELERYRELMTPPETFADGFTWKTVIGAFFLGALMMPATLYLNLVVGMGGHISAAGRWVTIIIFAEIARRSLKDLKMQEVYILYYMAGLATAAPFSGLLWNQYLVQSEFANAMGIAQEIPSWWAPSAAEIKATGRTFFTRAWLPPVLLVAFSAIIQKIDHYGLGYVMYRITSDVEKLPFPMAPVTASGIVALTESKESRERWRWNCFSIGGVLGLIFGAVYVGVPAVTGALLAKPLQLIPIPWIDFTPQLSKWLPATPINITLDFGAFLTGTVIPFWAVMGGAFGVVFTMIFNPILHANGVLSTWTPQMGFIDTVYANNVDFYLSFGIGLTIAVALVSLWRVVAPAFQAVVARGRNTARSREQGVAAVGSITDAWRRLVTNNAKRGDFSILISLGIYVFSSSFWILLSCWLVPGFPWPFFLFYAAVYTPVISYATAKLEGLCGQGVSIPMIREATYILSGYKGVKIWFAPAPIPNYGYATVEFRILELTGTKIISQIKTQILTLPIVVISSLIFSQVLWQMAPVPSDAYPFAQKMWELQAKNMCLVYSSTMEGGSVFMEAWDWGNFAWGMGSGVVMFALLSTFGLPTLLVFGMVRGLGESHPGAMIFQFAGAMVGHFYLKRRFGKEWLKYAPVILAGFSCGMGLIAMVSVSFTILTKMMTPLIY